jgi:hypothetical protein
MAIQTKEEGVTRQIGLKFNPQKWWSTQATQEEIISDRVTELKYEVKTMLLNL